MLRNYKRKIEPLWSKEDMLKALDLCINNKMPCASVAKKIVYHNFIQQNQYNSQLAPLKWHLALAMGQDDEIDTSTKYSKDYLWEKSRKSNH
ncbi:hypothetical protein QTP88_000250 [Uroleucon formosanum]